MELVVGGSTTTTTATPPQVVPSPTIRLIPPSHHIFSSNNNNNNNNKRSFPFHSSPTIITNPPSDWNPNSWNWDTARFLAKPFPPSFNNNQSHLTKEAVLNTRVSAEELVDGTLPPGTTNLYDHPQQQQLQPLMGSNNKRTKSGSPSSAAAAAADGGVRRSNYPKCQVDNCNEDLSTAKDYHRRHKVCQLHSKANNALVAKHIQRFCQQCSRFHHLSEFDEGKRSCRRRLAGHNRRRRKTQPEETTIPQMSVLGSHDNNASKIDIVNLLAVLARAQGTAQEKSDKFSSTPDKDQLIQILHKINSLPLPENLAAKLNGSFPNLLSSETNNQINEKSSAVDLLAVLSATPAAPSPDACETQSTPSIEGSDSGKSKSPPCDDQSAHLNLLRGPMMELPSTGGERSCTSYHSPMEEVDLHVQEASQFLPLQLFSPSPEDHSTRNTSSDNNYFSSDSSNRSPLSSPVVHDLFPMQNSREIMKDDNLSNSKGDLLYAKPTMNNYCDTSLQLFGCPTRTTGNGSIQSSPYRTGYTSSGSDISPSSLNSDAQDRTGRIVFKLFDKNPSQLPGSLRSQISNWLSNSPSEMESYIRPGCILLSLYLSMPSSAWDQFEENLVNYVKCLVFNTDVDFWGNGRFLVHTDRQMASHKDGRIRLCKSWRAWKTPELISVSPLALVCGQETSLLLRGRNLTAAGTVIRCTHAHDYNIREVPASSCHKAGYDEISLDSLKIDRESSSILGRCFIEVEDNIKGTSFPVIIADTTICQELNLLEPEINEIAGLVDGIPTRNIHNTNRPRSTEEVFHFLDELGWLFQRKHNSSLFEKPDYRLTRFKFLLKFSVERDFCALVKTLLDILLELNLGREGLAKKSLEMLSEIHLLNRAVKRKSRRMVNLLVHYPIIDPADSSVNFIFMPNMAGPGGTTPLHLAACTSSSDDIIDALTSDPQEIGLNSWKSVIDANGLSPYAYALMRNNHSYNELVARKLAARKNGEVSLSIENDVEHFQFEMDQDKKSISHFNRTQKSCSRCAVVRCRYSKTDSRGLLQQPYIHSMLLIAAVCVCVCLFLRGHPYVGCVSPFAWENLGFGAS